jgi:tRNA dimethylallyltransferase
METKPKIIIICGPTSSGKSDAAIQLAKKFDGEVISADSRQIYRGLDIGSGKIPKDFTSEKLQVKSEKNTYISGGIPHHLIDIAKPMEDFNVSHFKAAANEAIEDILKRGKLPIICGGTGFWINSIMHNMDFPNVEPDEVLRSMLHNKPAEELFAILSELDPDRAATIEKQNPVRLIRAIEIAKKLGTVPKPSTYSLEPNYSFLQIAIDVPREILNEKIKKRLDERFEQGMIEEVENLHNLPPAGGGVSWEWMEKIGLEYRWIARYLQNKLPLEEMKEKLYFDIIHYAKRQITWLKRDKSIIWLSDSETINEKVSGFLKNRRD